MLSPETWISPLTVASNPKKTTSPAAVFSTTCRSTPAVKPREGSGARIGGRGRLQRQPIDLPMKNWDQAGSSTLAYGKQHLVDP